MRRDCKAPEGPPNDCCDINRLSQTPSKLGVLQRPPVSVERHEVGLKVRTLSVTGGEAGIVSERLGVGGKKVGSERESAGKKLVADLFG